MWDVLNYLPVKICRNYLDFWWRWLLNHIHSIHNLLRGLRLRSHLLNYRFNCWWRNWRYRYLDSLSFTVHCVYCSLWSWCYITLLYSLKNAPVEICGYNFCFRHLTRWRNNWIAWSFIYNDWIRFRLDCSIFIYNLRICWRNFDYFYFLRCGCCHRFTGLWIIDPIYIIEDIPIKVSI